MLLHRTTGERIFDVILCVLLAVAAQTTVYAPHHQIDVNHTRYRTDLLVYPFLQKYFVKGMTLGVMKD